MFKVEIIERKMGRVVDTKEFRTVCGVKAFAFWWARQADTKNYEWRQVASEKGGRP